MEKQWPEACFSFGINSQYFQIQIKQNFSIYRVYSYHPTKDIFFWIKKMFFFGKSSMFAQNYNLKNKTIFHLSEKNCNS